jgi:uncharacterized phage protein gp47/JayE
MSANNCGCCELPASTPLAAVNRPGLSAIAFRAGTYGAFRLSMLQRIAGAQSLSGLKTRADDDYSVTIVDMWATVADILTFYQERIANEGFLRTARLRDSVLRMARLLDYQLRPGVAATALLAFTLDKDATLTIPEGLRVQSIPGEGEKPQVYETLESIAADSRLNRLRVLPAPFGFNPLARGTVSATVAPGDVSLAAAMSLSPGDRLIVFAGGGALEELILRERRIEEDRVTLIWTGPLQGANWDAESRVAALGRTFRVFGYNAPSQYMEATETPAGSGKFIWTRRTYSAANFIYSPAGNVIELDSKYEGIAVGSQLLISQPGASNQLATVTAVGQGPAKFLAAGAATTPVEDTVTRVTLSSAPVIGDRRTALIHETKGGRIRLWAYRYPEAVTGSTVYLPVKRIDSTSGAVGRVIEAGKYTAGSVLPLSSIEAGRQILLTDAAGLPVAGEIMSAAFIGLNVSVATTGADLTTAIQLKLDTENSRAVIAWRSAELPAIGPALTSTLRQIVVTIGALAPRTITLSAAPSSIDDAAVRLQTALNSSLPINPAFLQTRVLRAENHLLVIPGIRGAAISFAPTSADPTTSSELGLSSPEAYAVDALLSGSLSPFPAVTNILRRISVSFGPIGPRTIQLSAAPSTLTSARSLLQAAIRNASPAPAFARAVVLIVDTRLLIVPGTGGSPALEFLALTLESEAPINLSAATAVLIGNVALASHGETVADEVLGDGDASVPFQGFELQKKDLTYTPSAEAGSIASSLEVLVSDIRWTEVPSLFGKSPLDQVYTTRIADDGTVTVRFGDGKSGARLPSGRGNVAADYRHGTGLPGRVLSGTLRTPLDLPVGLRSVTNPAAATGGADAQTVDEARTNAPATVRTFGRAVSLRDFEDLIRAPGEVAKALATWVWNGAARAVHLTIAAQEGGTFTAADLTRLHASITAARDPNHALFLANFIRIPIVVTALLRVNANYIASKVAGDARAALLAALSFDTLRFGQSVAVSEIYTVLQRVPGVDSVDIDRFHFRNQNLTFLLSRGATAAPVQRSLRIHSARANSSPPPLVIPAELAFVESPADDIQLVTSGGLPD